MRTLHEVAENYFNTLNPIAERISTDIVAIKDAYEGLWNCLSVKEKDQIVNETVVHPEAILKYTLNTKAFNGTTLDIPLLTPQVTGTKYVVDESTGLSWRDEHSAPFSWKTPSQIDLSIFTSSKVELGDNLDSTHCKHDQAKIDQSFYSVGQEDSNKKSENFWGKTLTTEKNNHIDTKKNNLSSQPSNMVLVGTCSKLNSLCSKFKFLPGKSYSYEVQTIVTNSANEGGFLDRIKTSAVNKFQNTFKLVGGKSSDKKSSENKENENLLQPKGMATVIRLQKPSPKIAKPKSPPPPPPVVKAETSEEKEDMREKNLTFIKTVKTEKSNETDMEKVTLLEETSIQSFLSADPDSSEQDLHMRIVHELSDELNSISTECTPLSGPCIDVIPKSGFDFLDNW